MDVRYINPFITSCRQVFDTMVHVRIKLGKPYLRTHGGTQFMVSAVLGLGGAVTGCVVLRFSAGVAMGLASGLAKSPIVALDDDCVDALGEIANMVAGSAKKELPGGLTTLSVPSVVLGDHRINYPSGTPIIIIPCETELGEFIIEVALAPKTADDGLPGAPLPQAAAAG